MVDVHPIAQCQEVGETHTPGERPVNDRTGDSAGLAHKRDLSRNSAHMGVGGVQTASWHHQPNGIGTKHADTGFPRSIADRIHQWLAGFAVAPGHAAGHHNSRANACLAQSLDHLRHGIRGRTDNRQIGAKPHAGHLLDALHAMNVVVVVLVDHHQLTRITTPQQVPEYHATQVVRPFRGANNHDGGRVEKAFQITGAQASLLDSGRPGMCTPYLRRLPGDVKRLSPP